MKLIVATADTTEQWGDWSHTLGVFTSLEAFDKWVHENYTVDDIVYHEDKMPTYYIFHKDSVTDDGVNYYEVHVDDGCKYVDVGQYVTFEEFEVIG